MQLHRQPPGRDNRVRIKVWSRCDVRLDEAETSVLLWLLMHRDARATPLVTSYQPFSEWERVFPTGAMTIAAVHRLADHSPLAHGEVVSFALPAN